MVGCRSCGRHAAVFRCDTHQRRWYDVPSLRVRVLRQREASARVVQTGTSATPRVWWPAATDWRQIRIQRQQFRWVRSTRECRASCTPGQFTQSLQGQLWLLRVYALWNYVIIISKRQVNNCFRLALLSVRDDTVTGAWTHNRPTQYVLVPVPNPFLHRSVCCMRSPCPPITMCVVPSPLLQACVDWSTRPRRGWMQIVVVECGGAWLGCFHHLCWDIGSIITQQNGLSRLSALSVSQTDHRLTVWYAANRAAIMRSSRWLSVSVYVLLPHSFY